jgi:hypothetical protein
MSMGMDCKVSNTLRFMFLARYKSNRRAWCACDVRTGGGGGGHTGVFLRWGVASIPLERGGEEG